MRYPLGRRRVGVDDLRVAVDQLVRGVVPEMEMVVAARELVQPVVVLDMHVGVADEDVTGADVRRRDGKAKHAVWPRLHVALDHRASGGAEVLVPHDPVVLQRLRIDNEIRRAAQVRRPVAGEGGQTERAKCEQDLSHGFPPG